MPSPAADLDLGWLDQLTPDQAATLLTEAQFYEEKRAQTDSLKDFVIGAWSILEPGTPLIWNWHLDVLCAYLEAVYEKRITFLIINIPPGTMKSLIVSVFYPAWVWTRTPEHRFLCGSNEETLATRDSQRMRDLVESEWYQKRWGFRPAMDGLAIVDGTKISGAQRQKTLFQNTRRGHRESQGIFGRITGKRGDTIIWDDPHDVEKYLLGHEDVIYRVTDRWKDAWSTRVNDQDKSARILVMQRLHESDATSTWLDLYKDEPGFAHLCIPMRYEGEPGYDPEKDIGRPDLADPRTEEGEIMFPALFPEDKVALQERTFGPYGTAGQYQQRPSPLGGGEFKKEWLMHYTMKPRDGNRYIIVDPAGEKKKTNLGTKRDNTAMAVIEVCDDQNYYVIDAYVDRLGLLERTDILMRWHQKYRPQRVGYKATGFDSDIAHIRDRQERDNYRFGIIELPEQGHKNDRIRRLQPLFQDQRIWLPAELHRTLYNGETIDLIERFIEQEYSPFPVAKFDDFFDCLSGICDPELKITFPQGRPRVPGGGTPRFRDKSTGY